MASLVLGGIGAVVGGIYGGPQGAQLGWSLGSMAGSLIDPQKLPTQYGPKLGDLRVTTSTYGNYIPKIYGTTRLSGNMIWSTPIIETENSSTTGGKGPQQEAITYSYSQSFAIALCEGPITGIRKIWANGKIIYNVGDDASIETLIASNKIASDIQIYLGTSTQLPNSLIQSIEGVEKTSAYRDTVYIVFNNLQLADYGNRLPNLEFEVVNSGSGTYKTSDYYKVTASINTDNNDVFLPFFRLNSSMITSINENTQKIYVAGFLTPEDYSIYRGSIAQYNMFSNGDVSLNSLVDLDYLNLQSGNAYVNFIENQKSYDGSVLFTGLTTGFKHNLYILNDSLITNLSTYDTKNNISIPFDYNSLVCVKNNNYLVLGNMSNLGTQSITIMKFNGNSFSSLSEYNISYQIKCLEINNDYIYIVNNLNSILKYDFDFNLIETIYTTTGTSIITSLATNQFNNDLYGIITASSSDIKLYEFQSGNKTLINDLYLSDFNANEQDLFFKDSNFYTKNCGQNQSENNCYVNILVKNINNATVRLDDVVKDICNYSGVPSIDLDVTTLTNDYIKGYLLSQRMTARAALEPLMQSYFFDAVESDGKIKFIKRGSNTILTIPESDLSASNYGSELPDQLNLDRKQQLDLPEEITVAYVDSDASYQIGTQYSRRLIANTLNTTSIQLPLSLTPNEGKAISDILLYNYWQERTGFSFLVSNKYLYLDVTDVVNVYKNGKSYNVRLIDNNYQNGIISLSAVEEDATIYTQTGNGAPLIPPITEVALKTETNLQLLDIPILRDQDDKVGYYLAAAGRAAGWKGAQLFKSSDSGSSYFTFGSRINKESVIGHCLTKLNNFLSGNIFDEINTFTVITNLPLTSHTEIQILNGYNVALVGSEIIQFKNATLISENKYKISGLLRGRFGTEWAMNLHTLTDRFILLSPDSTFIEQSVNTEYNLERKYKAVSYGTFLNDTTSINFTNTAIAQKPYSPVQVGGGRDSAGNIKINWTRRTRINGAWNSNVEVSLGEDNESYIIEIMNGSTVIRTLTSSTTTVNYTDSMQITDFGLLKPNGTLTIKVYQLSAIIGKGYPGVAII